MESGFRSPLVDLFRRGEVERDIRVLAAQGALAPRALEQLALLIQLSDDADSLVRETANATLDAIPAAPLETFLGSPDVPDQMRSFFAARGLIVAVVPFAQGKPDAEPLPADMEEDAEETAEDEEQAREVLSSLPVVERMKLAMKGTRTQRAQLIRDSNKIVAAAVLSSPKLTESEVESFAKMANVTEEVLRAIAMNRSWVKNYGVVAGLTRNPKTPPAISMQMLQRLNERDLKMLSTDRNVPEAVRLAARKFIVKGLQK